MVKVIGVDPGLNGGIAIFDGKTVRCFTMPTYEVEVRKRKRREIDRRRLHNIFLDGAFYGVCNRVYVEKVHSMPQQSSQSMFSFGKAYGVILGMIASWEWDVVDVPPKTWQKELGVLEGKEGSIITATALMPNGVGEWHSHDGLAEAGLIAYYGWEKENDE